MSDTRIRTVGNVALGLSLLTFAVYFLNVLFGGPLGHKPWMSDLAEMLTLFVAVTLFVAGTLAREMQARLSASSDAGTPRPPEPEGGQQA